MLSTDNAKTCSLSHSLCWVSRMSSCDQFSLGKQGDESFWMCTAGFPGDIWKNSEDKHVWEAEPVFQQLQTQQMSSNLDDVLMSFCNNAEGVPNELINGTAAHRRVSGMLTDTPCWASEIIMLGLNFIWIKFLIHQEVIPLQLTNTDYSVSRNLMSSFHSCLS